MPVPGIGGQRLHILVMVLFAALMLVRTRSRAFLPLLGVARPFLVAMSFLAAVWFATNIYNGTSPRPAVEEAVQLVVFVTLGTAVFQAARDLAGGAGLALRWCGPICNLSLVTALFASMKINAVNPLSVLGETIRSGDPNVLQRELYKSSFVGFGLDDAVVRSQLRHEVFGAVLVATAVSFAAVRLCPLRSRSAAILFWASASLTAVMLLFSLSRSVLIAALLWPTLVAARAIQSGRLTPGLVASAAGAVLGVMALAASGFLSVLWIRFTQDTSSYQSREGLLKAAFRNIRSHWVTGGVNTIGESSHNFVLDSWLRSGVFAALAAVTVLVLLVGLFLGTVGRLNLEPEWMVPVMALLALVLVRMFTAGGGAFPPVEWVALAVVAGFMTFRVHGPLPAVPELAADHRQPESRAVS
ncbi:hypothetical protein [Nocardioides mesophilus]|uniref:O-antigen ligase family protein n=1 Tax=Nocardioides mesophilus TaxID=433659 RepID=A0A7G9REK5_9ACTN|nr:hypothetical protein [Nocardioides mesophilus]QNN54030.1 hypothetical protein H9L09_06530 [Nocardioides mesophilus]